MSDNGTSGSGMPQKDVDFLIACLQNTSGGSISVSCNSFSKSPRPSCSSPSSSSASQRLSRHSPPHCCSHSRLSYFIFSLLLPRSKFLHSTLLRRAVLILLSLQVNIQAVADLKGFTNPRSVSNKIAQLKTKYDLPIGATGGTPRKASSAAGPSQPAIPNTPSKQRVTKAKAVPKKKAVAKPKKVKEG
jgi:hypothetical protein